jgi:hypothetical protein
MSRTGDVYLPPPPPRSPGSAGSGSFPHRRVPPPPPTITTTLGSLGTGQQSSTGSGTSPAAYSYPYSPSAATNTPLSPYASTALSPLSQSNSRGHSPLASRPSTGTTMAVEYNPQQWGRGGPTGVQHRPFNALSVASRALDESGGKLLILTLIFSRKSFLAWVDKAGRDTHFQLATTLCFCIYAHPSV